MTTENNVDNGGSSANKDNKQQEFVPVDKLNSIIAERDQIKVLADQHSQENKTLKDRISAFGDITPEQIAELRKTVKNNDIKNKGADPDFVNSEIEKATGDLKSEFQKYKDDSSKSMSEKDFTIKTLKIENKFMSKVIPLINEDVTQEVMSIVIKEADFDDKGNLIFKDDSGKVRPSKIDMTKPFSVEEFIEELKVRKPSYFKAQGVTKGARDSGINGQGSPESDALHGVDIEEFKKIGDYYMSFSPEKRVKIASILRL